MADNLAHGGFNLGNAGDKFKYLDTQRNNNSNHITSVGFRVSGLPNNVFGDRINRSHFSLTKNGNVSTDQEVRKITLRYAGIGSRETPDHVLELMYKTAEYFARKGDTLISGGAKGADKAFESGCDNLEGEKRIFLPNEEDIPDWAYSTAKEYHPRWGKLGRIGKALHARNSQIVLAQEDRKPVQSPRVEFIVCYCPKNKNGKWMGGTSQALRIADHCKIPIYNFWYEHTQDMFWNYVTGMIEL